MEIVGRVGECDAERRDGRSHAERGNERAALSRRDFVRLASAAGATLAAAGPGPLLAADETKPPRDKALVAITLDLEMSRNFPTWETTHWDYEKGNLDADTKRYAVEAARRVKRRGGVIHFFAVVQTFFFLPSTTRWSKRPRLRTILSPACTGAVAAGATMSCMAMR